MAIQVKKRPFYYCFSGNPIFYELYSAEAVTNASLFFEVKVEFRYLDGTVEQTEGFPYTPVAGYAQIDIQEIIEGYLNYEVPPLTGNPKAITAALAQTGYFFLQFREITEQNGSSSWDASEEDHRCMAVKGGVSRFKYQGNNFFANYFNADVPRSPRPFFSWQKRGRLAAYSERIYLAYLLIDEVPYGNLVAVAKVTYTDGSFVEFTETMPVDIDHIYYLPAGAAQWGFSRTKQIWYWELTVRDTTLGNAGVLSENFRFTADNRNDYNIVNLHYRNSIGGLDSVMVRGVINYELDYQWTELQKVQRPDYYDGDFFDPQKVLSNASELQTMRGDIGHLEKEEQDRLRDVYIRRETWWSIGTKWWPVNVMTKAIKQRSSDSTRWTLPIDFTLAHDGNDNYTPDTIDLGDGSFTSNVCLAYLGSLAVAVAPGPTGYKTISVSFIEVDPENAGASLRYRVVMLSDVSQVVIPWTAATLVSPLQFQLPINDSFVFEAQAICANAIAGKKTSTIVSTQTNSGGGNNNSRIINNSSVNVPFTLFKDGVLITNGTVGSGANFNFDIAAGTGCSFYISLSGYSPPSATLSNGAITLDGGITIFGNTIIAWDPIDVTAGIVLTIN